MEGRKHIKLHVVPGEEERICGHRHRVVERRHKVGEPVVQAASDPKIGSPHRTTSVGLPEQQEIRELGENWCSFACPSNWTTRTEGFSSYVALLGLAVSGTTDGRVGQATLVLVGKANSHSTRWSPATE
ncbi:hypothetical protein E2C01_087260 [Portunus trituberculatus]|uniref:Uncharacterized protein n=1 Tax=Portunus trituberculatus TaxID=210409 RepID=A0A5B7JFP8_PORTR|nr:hypothetical protein [Portunus trituberculatus]